MTVFGSSENHFLMKIESIGSEISTKKQYLNEITTLNNERKILNIKDITIEYNKEKYRKLIVLLEIELFELLLNTKVNSR